MRLGPDSQDNLISPYFIRDNAMPKKSIVKYNRRVWLNELSSSSTGSIVLYDGVNVDQDENEYTDMYVEVGSCKSKATIHKGYYDSIDDYINKVKLMRDELNAYIDHLDESYNN